MKKIIANILLFLSFFIIASNSFIYAYSTVITGKITIEVFTIDGEKIFERQRELKITSKYPVLSGYTLPNIKITLYVIGRKTIQKELLTDAHGYWSYKLDTPLDEGQHKVYIRPADLYGNVGKEDLMAQIKVEREEKANLISNIRKQFRTDYTNISSMNLGSLGFLSLVYTLL